MTHGDPNKQIVSKSDVELGIELGKRYMEPKVIEFASPNGDKGALLAMPAAAGGFSVQSIRQFVDEFRVRPERRRGTARTTELASFIKHTNRFKDEHSVLFADVNPDEPKLLAVLDYHESGHASGPRFGTHRTEYVFPFSDEWTAWTGGDGDVMGQAKFAEFLESRIADVMPAEDALEGALTFAERLDLRYASPSELLALSKDLELRVGHKFRQRTNLNSGEVSLAFEEEHTRSDGRPLCFPTAFMISIPVFRGGDRWQVVCRLRYRAQPGGEVSWFYQLHRHDLVLDKATREVCEEARQQTDLPLLFGMPEA